MISGYTAPRNTETRACNCIGPQRGDPVCPCLMRARVAHDIGLWAAEVSRQTKPRVRVKAIGRLV